jgi:guanine deaminase
VHYCQSEVIASYGTQLLEWLERYTYPCERRFDDPVLAREAAEFFLDELLRNGTTTALVFATVHPESAEALFEAAYARRMRIAAGKVMQDRNCPGYLRDTPESSYADSKALIERWHGVGRLRYALTPRFAPSSSDRQLERAGMLAAEHPDVLVHTHVAENVDEVAWVRELFPWSRSYLDVYDRFGLLRERAVYAHCLHLDAQDRTRMAECGAAMAFCPTSNLFLGSGLFDLDAAQAAGVRVGVGTDVGGGTSFSMLRTLAEGYKVAQLAGQSIAPWRALYLATLGGARALGLDARIGSLEPGKEADIVVFDPEATPVLARRMRAAESVQERLFAQVILGDDRSIAQTYVMGEHARPTRPARTRARTERPGARTGRGRAPG